MTLHPDEDSSDETDGKYSTDEKMTFNGLLKRSLSDRDDGSHQRAELVGNEESSSTLNSTSESPRRKSQDAGESQREESPSAEREALATALGETHVSGQCFQIIAGETPHVGLHSDYEFARTKLDGQQYYYLVQITDQSYENHHGKLAVRDFGIDWDFIPAIIDSELLRNVFKQQRQADMRAGREPVDWLNDSQYEAVNEWYQERVEHELDLIEELPRERTENIQLLDRFLIIEASEAVLGVQRHLPDLSSRQAEVLKDGLPKFIGARTDLPPAVCNNLSESIDYPLIAQLTFERE